MKKFLQVLSPWSGEVVGEVSLAGPGEWEAAVSAAERAAVTLRKMSSQERRDVLLALVAGVKACQAELAQTIMAEGGKPITYARGEVSRGGDDAFPGGEGSAPAEGRCGIEGLRKFRESG